MRGSPIFLQTGFRSGGTWLWSRFRGLPGTMAYCEPLNEILATATLETISGLMSATSNLNHPMMEAPYFQEYSDLLNEDGVGVKGYQTDFGLEGYFAPPDVPHPELARYLGGLLDHAERCGKQPVLKFTRALGRAAWLRREFPGAKQILLVRRPLPQFRSGWELARRHENFAFLMIPLFTLSRVRDGAIGRVCDALAIPHIPSSEGLAACTGGYVALARTMPARTLFGAFLALFIAAHAKSAPFADLVIDQDALEGDRRYRDATQARLRDLSGLPVDLSNCRDGLPARPPAASADELGAIDLVGSLLGGDHPESVAFARTLLSDRRRG